MSSVFDQADAFVLGRKTYEIFAAYWPRVTDPVSAHVEARKSDLAAYLAVVQPAGSGFSYETGKRTKNFDSSMVAVVTLSFAESQMVLNETNDVSLVIASTTAVSKPEPLVALSKVTREGFAVLAVHAGVGREDDGGRGIAAEADAAVTLRRIEADGREGVGG